MGVVIIVSSVVGGPLLNPAASLHHGSGHAASSYQHSLCIHFSLFLFEKRLTRGQQGRFVGDDFRVGNFVGEVGRESASPSEYTLSKGETA